MADPKVFELVGASIGEGRSPLRALADGGCVLNIALPEGSLADAGRLVEAAKGKSLRILIEVTEPQTYGKEVDAQGRTMPKGQPRWVPIDNMEKPGETV